MKERLVQLLDLEQLTPSKFADIIGVQRSSVSHVISGRNNPSFDFLQKTLKAFPGLNAEWLILGEGTMYEQMGRTTAGTLFDAAVASHVQDGETASPADHIPEEAADTPDLPEASEQVSDLLQESANSAKVAENKEETSRIIKVLLLYGDGTFSTFEPS